MADSLVGLDSGGCVSPIANGSVGQVLAIGAGGTPVWTAAATDDQTASEVAYESAPAGTPLFVGTVEGALDVIAPCLLCSVISDNTCTAGGVGTDYMVRTATKNLDGTLTLDGAPEHYSIVSRSAAGLNIKNIVGPQVGGGNTMQTLSATLTNPSTCRNMNYLVSINFGATSYIITGDIIEDMRAAINGPAGVLFNNYITSVSMETLSNTLHSSPLFAAPSFDYVGTIPPGGSVTYDFTVTAITRLYNQASGIPGINPMCSILESTITFFGATTQ